MLFRSDLYAPVGSGGGSVTYEEARDFVLEHFKNFSPELSAFAQRAFQKNWLDAEMREGKAPADIARASNR